MSKTRPNNAAHCATYRAKHREELNAADRVRQAERRERIAAIKLSSGCVDCGYAQHPQALDFDHLPGVTKGGNVAIMVSHHVSWERIEAEISKCEVVCANCHRVRSYNRRNHGN